MTSLIDNARLRILLPWLLSMVLRTRSRSIAMVKSGCAVLLSTRRARVGRYAPIAISALQVSLTRGKLWSRFIALAKHLRKNDVSISYFSATPQGALIVLSLVWLW
jgi:hypothetical protein